MLITADTKTSLRSAVRRLRLLVATPADRVEAERVVEERGTGCTSEGMSAISIVLDTTLAYLCTLVRSQGHWLSNPFAFSPDPRVATRQTSSSGKAKSPRIQVVLPEDLCQRLAELAELESRTVSNMAKVLIQQGVERLEQAPVPPDPRAQAELQAALFRQGLEARQGQAPQRLRGAPRRVRLHRPG